MGLSREADEAEEDDEPETQEYPVRLWATFRCVCETEIEATSHEEAVAKARELDPDDFNFNFAEGMGIDGDVTAHVDWPDEDDETRDAFEVDLREEGEPFSWVACEIVKDLAKLASPDGSLDASAEDATEKFVRRAVAACTKKEVTPAIMQTGDNHHG
jgi:hypothetical protein